MRACLLFALALPFGPFESVSAQDLLADGLTASALPQFAGPSITLGDGRIVVFDGAAVSVLDADGLLLDTLLEFDPPVFTGALAIDPSESWLLVGESTVGEIYRVALDGSEAQAVATLPLNASAAFDGPFDAIVSAATCGFGCGNDLLRVDLASGHVTRLAAVDGASGPVAVAENGDLYYATVSADFPSPPASTSLLRFAAADLDGAGLLDENDAETVADGFDGAASLAIDLECGALFLAESSFGTGTNRIVRIDAAGDATTLVEGPPFQWIAGLQLLPGDGDGFFHPFQPDGNGTLVYSRTDFYFYDERMALEPARASLDVESIVLPGTLPTVEATVAGGPANGSVVLVACPTPLVGSEVAVPLFGKPLIHTGFDLGALIVGTEFLALDENGAGTDSMVDPTGVLQLVTLQALLFEGDAIVGTTNAASL